MTKKILIIIAILILPFTAFSQEIPKKMTRGIEVTHDDFAQGTKYYAGNSGLTIIHSKDACTFEWKLFTYAYIPVSFKKVQIAASGKVFDIQFTDDQYSEHSVVITTAVGTRYVKRERLVAAIKVNALDYLDALEAIAADKENSKIRFSNPTEINQDFNKALRTEISKMLEIYKLLTN